MMVTKRKKILFCSHITRGAQYDHPCAPQYLGHRLVRSLQHPFSLQLGNGHLVPHGANVQVPIHHTHFHQPHVLVPANPYLHEGKGTTTVRRRTVPRWTVHPWTIHTLFIAGFEFYNFSEAASLQR